MSTALRKKNSAAAESYRTAMPVVHFREYCSTVYYLCPRCNITMEREFMRYCDRCGQCLDWRKYRKAVAIPK